VSKMKVYLDTSVISALFDERTPERQNLTKAAWDILDNYDVCVSELVVDELSAAPPRPME
jgi:predicted nucleic acid-binding protein